MKILKNFRADEGLLTASFVAMHHPEPLAPAHGFADLPHFMPGMHWARQPNHAEHIHIAWLEARVEDSRRFYEMYHHDRFESALPQNDKITPPQYLDYLGRLYEAYEGENAKIDRTRAWNFHQHSAAESVSRLPSAPLNVLRYGDRPVGKQREYSLNGDRCDYDHIPLTQLVHARSREKFGEKIPNHFHRDKLTARSTPSRLHHAFHQKGPKLPEKPLAAAREHMAWMRDGLHAQGYSWKQILASERAVNERNHAIGVYDL